MKRKTDSLITYGTRLRNGGDATVTVRRAESDLPTWEASLDAVPHFGNKEHIGAGVLRLSRHETPAAWRVWRRFLRVQPVAHVAIEALAVSDRQTGAGVATGLLYTALRHEDGVNTKTMVTFDIPQYGGRTEALCAWAGHVGLRQSPEESRTDGYYRFEAPVSDVMVAIQDGYPKIAQGSVARGTVSAQ